MPTGPQAACRRRGARTSARFVRVPAWRVDSMQFVFQNTRPSVVVGALHIIAAMNRKLLGGLTARDFLARHWQKRPLFVRRAVAAPALVDARALMALARRDEVESRIVQRRGRRWNTEHGPFAKIKASKINWSVLVNGVNHHVAGAEELLRRFFFVPQARLDDVMVSYATPGGGVGPHVDSYDVFLIQGTGRRRWRIGRRVFVAGPGDLIYVPPGLRHDGVALEPCFTYSIGFRAPRGAELGAAFLDWLHERGLPDARYRDPGLRPASRPGRIPPELTIFARQFLATIRWTHAAVARLLEQPGRELRVFDPDATALRLNESARIATLERFLLASRTRRVYLVLHDTEHLTRRCPRMMALLGRFAHAIQINRTHEEIREIQDSFLVLDAQHYVRRPVAAFFRGAVGLGDETEGLAMRSRFMEIWGASFPAVSGTTLGL